MYKIPKFPFSFGRAICYSGFRQDQAPGAIYPSYNEIKEDLLILQGKWQYIRLYDCDLHGERVLEVIKKENLKFKVMLGAYIVAEVNNHGCPWGGGVYSEIQLAKNKKYNEALIDKLIDMANQYPAIVCMLSVGNEACVDWTDHMVPTNRVIKYVEQVKQSTSLPVTFCENYVPWLDKLQPLADVVDCISIHTYPVWEYKNIDQALQYTKDNYYAVVHANPHKPVIITEAGWTTKSNGQGIRRANASQELQKIYLDQLIEWTDENQILTFVFEAFDERWKGSDDPLEPEKHWGIYKENRTAKAAAKKLMPTS